MSTPDFRGQGEASPNWTAKRLMPARALTLQADEPDGYKHDLVKSLPDLVTDIPRKPVAHRLYAYMPQQIPIVAYRLQPE